jgi:hypothetical protein
VAESFAGITVPTGEAAELRSAARALSELSHDLESTARALDDQPTLLGGWIGPASVAYAGACLATIDGVRAGAHAAHAASGALSRFGEGLQDAQRDARHAIAQARDAQQRIERAEHAVADARARAAQAAARDAAAGSRIALTSVVGVPPPDAVAEQARARSDAAAAQIDGAGAEGALDAARADLARARAAGEHATQHARAAARAAAAAFDAASGGGPGAGANGAPPSGVTDGGWVALAMRLGSPLTGVEIGLATGALEQSLNVLAHGVRKLVTYRGGEMMSVGWRYRANGDRTWLARTVHGVTEEAYDDAVKIAGNLEKAGTAAKRAGGIFGAVTAGADQYGDDADRHDLSTTDKVGRIAAVSGYKGALSWGAGAVGAEVGAAYGSAIGSAVPGVGTITGAAVGAVIGGVIGSGVGDYVADTTKGLALDLGATAANLVVDGGKATEAVAGRVLDSVNPF